MDDYDPTRAARIVQDFAIEQLSNWYVRRNRRRFWKGELNADKVAAYQTLFECLVGIVKMMAPIAPFLSDELYRALMEKTGVETHASVHIAPMVEPDPEVIDHDLERRMELAQLVVFLARSMRSRSRIKVRQPLGRISIPASDETRRLVEGAIAVILDEINVKEIEFVDENSPLVQKNATPNFRKLGPRFGKQVNQVAAVIRNLTQDEISTLERVGTLEVDVDGEPAVIEVGDVSIKAMDIEGWMVESADGITVAMDTTLTPELVDEGLAREFVNRVQNMRKEAGFEVTDRILVGFKADAKLTEAIVNMSEYVRVETLALEVEQGRLEGDHRASCEIDGQALEIAISRVNGA